MDDSAPWKAEETIVGWPRLLVALSFSFLVAVSFSFCSFSFLVAVSFSFFQSSSQATGEPQSVGARDTDGSVVQVASQSFLGESDAVLQPVADQGGDGL